MNILVTGAAGFIGCAVCRRLLDRGDNVTGLDNINDYYDPELKYGRLAQLVSKRMMSHGTSSRKVRPKSVSGLSA